MKTSLRILLLLPACLTLVSWSPPDPLVGIGADNTTGGYNNADPLMTITPFRGFLAGNGNKVGSVNSPNHFAAVVGTNNTANLYSSILAGDSNNIAVTADTANLSSFLRSSGVFGTSNTLANGCGNVVVSGYGNSVTASSSLVVGSVNTVGATGGGQAYYSAAIGIGNQIIASQGWVIGNTSTVTNTGGIAIGTGLSASKVSSIALGKWNSSMGADDLLVVGRGTSSTSRATALTITNAGAVIIPGSVSISGAANLQGATAQTLTVSGNATLQGTTTAQNLTVSGNSTLQGSITALNLTTTGSATLAGVSASSLFVSGASSLAAASATTLTTTGDTTLADTTALDLTVSGDTTLEGATVLEGSVTLAQAQGDISMGIYGE